MALVLGLIAVTVTIVSGIVVIALDYFSAEEPKVKFAATYLRNPVRTQFGEIVPEEIGKQIPSDLRPFVQTIELYAFKDCAYLDRLLRETEGPDKLTDRLLRIYGDQSIWQVVMDDLRGQSEYPDDDLTRVKLELLGESASDLPVVVKEVALRLSDVERPPTPSEACLYAYVRFSKPFVPPPLFRIEVPPTAKAGDTIATSKTVSNEYIGIHRDTGFISFQVDILFQAAGGYSFDLQVAAAEASRPEQRTKLYTGSYRWLKVDDLSKWRLVVDAQPPRP